MLKTNFIIKLKHFFFPFYKNKEIKFVLKKLNQSSPENKKAAMFVGGCVRKHLTNKHIDDIDIATILTTDEIKENFKNTKFNIIDSGVKHGTITLVSKKLKLEITTLRKDIKTDGRHAEIKYTNDWQEDSERRDFTINAIYLDANGNIFDPQLGIEDLKNKNIKFIGDPQKRIDEDHLRIIRYLRFSLEYISKVDHNTLQVIKTNLDTIKKISKERIFSELLKILKLKNFLKINNNTDLKLIFELVFPELKYLKRLSRLNSLQNFKVEDNEIILAILLIDEKNNHEYFTHKYNVSNYLKDKLNLLAKNYLNVSKDKNFLKKDLLKNLYYFGKKHLQNLNLLHYAYNKQTKIKDYFDILKKIEGMNIPNFKYDGNYLKKYGMKEGTLIGKTLKIIEDEWLKNNFKISNSRVEEIITKQNN
tara:strand:- start:17003 stop:18259 length:1257 start_codon:yes stop_codon:yes gene_type:complete